MTASPADREYDMRIVSAAELDRRPHASIMSLDDLLPILASPDSRGALQYDSATTTFTDGERAYPTRDGSPLLLPSRLQPYFEGRLQVPFDTRHDAFLQYFLLSSIKQAGEINAASTDMHYERHLARMQEFCGELGGRTLDVGCDNPQIGSSLLPAAAQYVGLDPFSGPAAGFRLVGLAEYLPFKDASADGVIFNTSLDHVLDYHRAIDEAHRVLVPGGKLIVASIVWTQSAELVNDSVHFHHFREFELMGALSRFEISKARRYDYKGDAHRFGLYVQALKR